MLRWRHLVLLIGVRGRPSRRHGRRCVVGMAAVLMLQGMVRGGIRRWGGSGVGMRRVRVEAKDGGCCCCGLLRHCVAHQLRVRAVRCVCVVEWLRCGCVPLAIARSCRRVPYRRAW